MNRNIFIGAIIIIIWGVGFLVQKSTSDSASLFAQFVVKKEISEHQKGNEKKLLQQIAWDQKNKTYSLAGGGTPDVPPSLENLSGELVHGVVMVRDGEKIIWKSSDLWWVDSFAFADVDSDGKNELGMSVWKQGNFGPSKPFWISENDTDIKNHVFVFKVLGTSVSPMWQSSDLEKPNCAFAFRDLDGNGQPELLAAEGLYRDDEKCVTEHLAVWKWNGWGFTNDWRSKKLQ